MKASEIKEDMHIKLGVFEDQPEQCAIVSPIDEDEDDYDCICVSICRHHIHHYLDGGDDDGCRELSLDQVVCEVTECIPKATTP